MNKEQMIKKIKLAVLSCLIIFSFITEKVNLVYADVDASIDVLFEQQFIDGHRKTIIPSDHELIYELVAKEASNPMPVGSVGGVYETTLKGNVDSSMKIAFDMAGEFEYTLKVSSKNDLQGLIPASDMSYRIVITVLKKMEGNLEPFAFAFNSDGEKVADPPFVFTVEDAEATVTPEPTNQPKPTQKPRPTKEPWPSRPGKGGIARTGDTTKIYTLIALGMASTGVIILAVLKRRRKDQED